MQFNRVYRVWAVEGVGCRMALCMYYLGQQEMPGFEFTLPTLCGYSIVCKSMLAHVLEILRLEVVALESF